MPEYNQAIAAGDNATADLLKVILQDEEHHVDFLETRFSLIKDLGLESYLVERMGGKDEDGK